MANPLDAGSPLLNINLPMLQLGTGRPPDCGTMSRNDK